MPILFQGKYDLNRKRITMILDPDLPEERHAEEEYEVYEEAHRSGLAIACVTKEGIVRDIRVSGDRDDNQPWDVYLTDVSEDSRQDIFSEIEAKTPAGEEFVKKYLASVLVTFECRHCNKNLTGDEAFRNFCLCAECEAADPNYFEDNPTG